MPGRHRVRRLVVQGDGLVLECHAEGGGEIVLESRNGFMPVSLPKVENAAAIGPEPFRRC